MSEQDTSKRLMEMEMKLRELSAENGALRVQHARWMKACTIMSVMSSLIAVCIVMVLSVKSPIVIKLDQELSAAQNEVEAQGSWESPEEPKVDEEIFPAPETELNIDLEPSDPVVAEETEIKDETPVVAEEIGEVKTESPGLELMDLEAPELELVEEKEVEKKIEKKEKPKPKATEPFALPGSLSFGGEEYDTYTVRRNETLYKISRRFFGSHRHVKKIMRANGLRNHTIYPGMKLKIPRP